MRRKGLIAGLSVMLTLGLPTLAPASVETMVVTMNTRGMTANDRLNHACQDATLLLADLNARFGKDVRTSKGAPFQIRALRIEAFACRPKRAN